MVDIHSARASAIALVVHTRAYAAGDVLVALARSAPREVGDLARAFDDMQTSLKEREVPMPIKIKQGKTVNFS